MAAKSNVQGNRVTIDTWGYDVTPKGAGKYAVSDMFGGNLGTFVIRGKRVVAEDWDVPDAHPVAEIGKLWAAANVPEFASKVEKPACKMVCALATHASMPPAEREKATAYRVWLKAQPGFKIAFFAEDPSSGKVVSISVWKTKEHLAALKGKTPPDGAAVAKHTTMEIFTLTDDL